MMTDTPPIDPGLAAAARRRYEHTKAPFVAASRVRADVLGLLAERKQLRRTAERLMTAALPYAGDPNVKAAIEEFRAVLEGRAGDQPS